MKKIITCLLCLRLVLSTDYVSAEDELNMICEEYDQIYRPGNSNNDGGYTSLGLSMLGWGLGIAAGIGLLASLLHQSTGSSSSSNTQ
ncbi:MAG: hypothetical protein EBZ47_01280 [Chlamydiae bacterium]|nr:hypothetical protein [Chlamydiota bacterium]